jgi:hypothetical protein
MGRRGVFMALRIIAAAQELNVASDKCGSGWGKFLV